MTAEELTAQELRDHDYSMYDIHTKVFLDIAAHEDPEGKLKTFLLANFSFDGKRVLEAGAGAGRITDYYADRAGSVVLTDAYDPMLTILKRKYGTRNNIAVEKCVHRELKSRFHETFDIFLSAFSLAYDLDPEIENYDDYLENILPAARQHIIIECCGIYERYDLLSPADIRYDEALDRRFHRKDIRTVFVFSSPELAYKAAGYLFPEAAERVKQENLAVIPEMISVFYD